MLDAGRLTGRTLLGAVASAAFWPLRAQVRLFDVQKFGAAGDGNKLDTAPIQRTIDEAAGVGGGQVLIRGGKKYLVSTLVLRSGIEFHLADDAELLVSADRSDYPEGADGILTAYGAKNLKFIGTGTINSRALDLCGASTRKARSGGLGRSARKYSCSPLARGWRFAISGSDKRLSGACTSWVASTCGGSYPHPQSPGSTELRRHEPRPLPRSGDQQLRYRVRR
jgi:polygalacturonase